MIINYLVANPSETPLTRKHKIYGTTPAEYNRIVILDRWNTQPVNGTEILNGMFNISGLPESMVDNPNYIALAISDDIGIPPLALDRIQIGI